MKIQINPMALVFAFTLLLFIVTGIGYYMSKKITDSVMKPKKLRKGSNR